MKILLLASMALITTACAENSITKIAQKNSNFTILTKALKAANLDKALNSKGSFTVFAPTDDAFKRLPKGTLKHLLKPENKEQLSLILKYHVLKGKISAKKVVSLDNAQTLANQKLKISFDKARLYINDSKVIDADIQASNGVIHVLNEVLLPPIKATHKKNRASLKMLDTAIDSGVDLFNSGDHAACEAIYSVAVRGIAYMQPPALKKDDLDNLKKALKKAEKSTNSRADAWTLRRAMNQAYQKLNR